MSLPFTINYPTSLDDTTSLGQLANNIRTPLTDGVDAAVSTIPVDTTGMPADGIFSLDNEICTYTGKTGSSLTGVTRAVDGSSAAAHTLGTNVEIRPVAKAITILRDAILQIESRVGVAGAGATPVANSIFAGTATGVSSWSLTPIIGTSLQIGVASSATGALKLAHASSAFLTTIQAGNAAAARTYTWPTNFGAAGTVLTDAAGDGVLSWGAAGSGANTALSNLASVAITAALNTSGVITQTSASATAFESGPNGATNPVLRLVNSTASQATGLSITGNAAGAGVTLTALSSGADESIILAPKGTGQIVIPTGTAALPTFVNTNASVTGFFLSSGKLTITSGGIQQWQFNGDTFTASPTGNGIQLGLTGFYRWSTTTGLSRNAAGVVEINNGTAGQWGSLFAGVRDAGTTTVTNGLTLGHQSTGTPAAGLGSAILYNINSSTTADRNAAQIAALWLDPADGTRTADLVFYTVNSAAALAETFRVGARGAVTFKVLTFATLPASPVAGMMCGISDSNVSTFNTAITAGGGANKGLAYYDGAAWTFH